MKKATALCGRYRHSFSTKRRSFSTTRTAATTSAAACTNHLHRPLCTYWRIRRRDHLEWRNQQSEGITRRNKRLLQQQRQPPTHSMIGLPLLQTRCFSSIPSTTDDTASLSATNKERKNARTAATAAAASSSSNNSSSSSSSSSDSNVPAVSSTATTSETNPSSSSSSEAATSIDNTIATAIEDRFLALELATRQCLLEIQQQQQQHSISASSSSDSNSTKQCQALLQQWRALLPDLEHYYCNYYHLQQQKQEHHTHTFEKKHNDMIVQAVERMEDLFSELVVQQPQPQPQTQSSTTSTLANDDDKYDDSSISESSSAMAWLMSPSTSSTVTLAAAHHHQNNSKTTYQSMLQAVSRYHPTGATALRILQAWNDALQGDLEQAPTKEDYHAVLQAYANQDYDNDNKNNNKQTTKLSLDDPLLVDMTTGADVAWEIVQYLQQAWNTSMRPDIITHALALQCMARPLAALSRSTLAAANVATAAANEATTVAEEEQEQADIDPAQEFVSTLRENMAITQNEFLKQLKVWMVPSALSGVFRKPTAAAYNTNEKLQEKQEQVVCILRALDVVVQQQYPTAAIEHNAAAAEKGLFEWVQLWKQIITMQNLDASNRKVEQVLGRSATTILQNCLNEASAVRNGSDEAMALCQLIDTTLVTLERFQQPYLPHDHHYFLAINARKSLVKGARYDARIQEWVERIENIHKAFHLSPNDFLCRKQNLQEVARSFSDLMKIYYDSGRDDRVERIWNDMAEKKEIIPMNTFSVAFILKSLARHQQSPLRAAQKAQAILGKVLAMDPSDPNYFKPTAQHYGSVMVAWQHTEHPKACSKCRAVMDRLIRDSKDNPELQPNAVHYAALIGSHGWTIPGRNDPKAVSEEEQQSLFKAIDEAMASGVEIDLRLYRAMLVALSRIGSEEADDRALKLLDDIILAYEKGGRDDLKPSSSFVSMVMYAWSRSCSPRAVEQCESLLRRLEVAYDKSGDDLSMRPNADCYKTLIHAYINLGIPDSAKLAERVLDRMESAALSGKADFPNKMIYAEIITAYGKSDSPDAALKAESILTRMAKSYMFGNSGAKPDGRICSALLYSWAKSSLPDKASRSKALLDRMCLNFRKGDRDMKPFAPSFVAVLNACAHTNTQGKNVKSMLVRIALATLDDMENILGESNEIAYRQIFLVIRRHVGDEKEREQLTHALFSRCCEGGFVSSNILRTVRKLDPSLETNRDQMPPSWTRNIKSS